MEELTGYVHAFAEYWAREELVFELVGNALKVVQAPQNGQKYLATPSAPFQEYVWEPFSAIQEWYGERVERGVEVVLLEDPTKIHKVGMLKNKFVYPEKRSRQWYHG